MRSPGGWYRVEEEVAARLPGLTAAQRRGLALWVYGAVLARSGCQSAVVGALLAHGRWDALRQRLREWLYDGCDKAAPCRAQVPVALCFAPLLRWSGGGGGPSWRWRSTRRRTATGWWRWW